MRLTRRGLLTGAAALALKPLTVPLTPYAHGFTVADVANAVEALEAASVPAFEGYYHLHLSRALSQVIFETHIGGAPIVTSRRGARVNMVIVDDPLGESPAELEEKIGEGIRKHFAGMNLRPGGAQRLADATTRFNRARVRA